VNKLKKARDVETFPVAEGGDFQAARQIWSAHMICLNDVSSF